MERGGRAGRGAALHSLAVRSAVLYQLYPRRAPCAASGASVASTASAASAASAASVASDARAAHGREGLRRATCRRVQC